MNVYKDFKELGLNELILERSSNDWTRRKYVRNVVTDELLIYLYFELGYSAYYISTLLKQKSPNLRTDAGTIIQRLKDLNENTRNTSDSSKLISTQIRRKNTHLKKYGTDHPSKLDRIKQLKKEQCLLKYGVDNNFKAKEIKQKIKETNLKRYGVENPGILYSKRNFSLTKPHKKVLTILDELGINYRFEQINVCKRFNPILQKTFNPRVDIIIDNKKLVIEIFGCYWHATPKKYKESDLFYTIYGPMTAKQIWEKDRIKIEHIKDCNFNIEVVWEDEIDKEYIIKILQKYEN